MRLIGARTLRPVGLAIGLVGLVLFSSCSERIDALIFNPCSQLASVQLVDTSQPLEPDEWSQVQAIIVSPTSVRRVESGFTELGEQDYGAQVTLDNQSPEFLRVEWTADEAIPVLIPASMCS